MTDRDTFGRVVATFSIAACDLDAGQWGVAVQSKFLAVGSVVPWAAPRVGAIATQAYANPRYGPDGLALLRQGSGPSRSSPVSPRRTRDATSASSASSTPRRGARRRPAPGACTGRAAAPGRATRRRGTSSSEPDGRRARGDVGRRAGSTRPSGCSTVSQQRRLPADSRGQQSASLLVVERDGAYAGLSDIAVDLRVDDHPRPIEELERIHGLHVRLFGKSPRETWIPVDDALAAEPRTAHLARLRR